MHNVLRGKQVSLAIIELSNILQLYKIMLIK